MKEPLVVAGVVPVPLVGAVEPVVGVVLVSGVGLGLGPGVGGAIVVLHEAVSAIFLHLSME